MGTEDGSREPAAADRLSAADAVLWALDRDPLLRSPITAVVLFDREPPFDAVLERFETLCRHHAHFRSTVEVSPWPWTRPRWRECPDFDAAEHLCHVRVARPGNVRQVLDLAQGNALAAFDPVRPPWQATVVDGVDGGRGALVLRVHHTAIDGVGGLLVAARMMDRDRVGTPLVPAPPVPTVGDRPERPGSCRARSLARAGAALPGRAASMAWEATARPGRTATRWWETATDAARLVAPAPGPRSPLLGGRGISRRFVTLDLTRAELSEAARASGLTLNDVFVAGLLRGLSLYHHGHGARAPVLRTVMPVSTRRPSDPMESNRFVPVRVELPADLPAASDYLRVVPPLLERWKHSGALGVSDLITTAVDRLPGPLTVGAMAAMLKGVDLVATNVPGPPMEAFVAGARIDGLYAFAPTAGAALNAALVTLAGRPSIGLTVDTAAVPDPDVLEASLSRGLDEVTEASSGEAVDHRP